MHNMPNPRLTVRRSSRHRRPTPVFSSWHRNGGADIPVCLNGGADISVCHESASEGNPALRADSYPLGIAAISATLHSNGRQECLPHLGDHPGPRPTLVWLSILLTLALPLSLFPSPARAQLPVESSLASDCAAPAGPSDVERHHALELAKQAIELLDHNDLEGAQVKLREALVIIPSRALWRYNLACILAVRGKRTDALDQLERATQDGFTAFGVIESNSAFDKLRDLPRYKTLLAHKDEITHAAAEKAVAELKQRFGDGYLYEIDEQQKLIFATNIDRATLDSLKTWLSAQAKSQDETLFEHKPDEFIRIVVPSPADFARVMRRKGVMGIYEDQTRTLLAQRLGQVMTHEFTHALHAADQRAVGQSHPIWIREGLAAMYEPAQLLDGKLVPSDNFRLGFVQSAARRHALIPFGKMLTLKQKDFMAAPNLTYGQTSSVMLYLYDKGLLRNFYDTYKANYPSDRTGRIALEKTTGMTLADLQKTWTAWMLDRTGPRLAGPGSGYLGVHFGLANDGLKINFVVPNTPAAIGGLKVNDLIVGVDNREVRDYPSFAPLMAHHKPGDTITFKIRRAGTYIDVEVAMGKR